MALLSYDCPNCLKRQMTMRIYGWKYFAKENLGGRPGCHVSAFCADCDFPLTFIVEPNGDRVQWDDFRRRTMELAASGGAAQYISQYGLVAFLVLPPADRPAPEHLPADVAKALEQAQRNYAMEGCEEPAAVFFGRAIERALAFVHASVKGTLAQRIRKLADQKLIPEAMADWADEVRVVRNDGAHDEGVSREDLDAARDFTDAFLRYLITMPKMVEDRRAKAAAAVVTP